MTDDDLRDEFGDEITAALRARAVVPAAVPIEPTAVERSARRARSRRRVLVAALVVAIGATSIGVVVARGHDTGNVKVETTPSTNGTTVLTTAPTTALKPGYRLVSYRGVHVAVPTRWPVVDGMHTGFCSGPFPARPTAFVGPQDNGAPSCSCCAPSPSNDGVWLAPGEPPATARPVTTATGLTVFEDPGIKTPSLEQLWYHDTFVEIGIGPDPAVAKAILHSLGYTPGAPDTAAAGACARSAHPNGMPTPERLTQQLMLVHGQLTLNPVAPSDQPTMTAARAWTESGPKEWFEQYRVILARYSASIPARQNPDGSLTPLYQNVLAWVVYSTPTSPTVNGCGGWGLDIYDAQTGKPLGDTGYSPGP